MKTSRSAAAGSNANTPLGNTLLNRIAEAAPSLRQSERAVAELVLADPAQLLQLSIAETAERAGVSQPTVARFAAALGFSGFREFKLRLAQSVATGVRYVHADVQPSDPPDRLVAKVFDRAVGALIDVRNHLDPRAFARAVELLTRARRVECFGLGNSAVVAQDAQHKLLRYGIPCAAYSDPHSMGIVATVLQRGDVVLVISASGRTVDALDVVRTALDAGAKVLAVTRSATPLAALASVTLHADVHEDPDVYTPMTSRLAHLTVIDALSVGVALALGPTSMQRLERIKRNVRQRRLAQPEAEPTPAKRKRRP